MVHGRLTTFVLSSSLATLLLFTVAECNVADETPDMLFLNEIFTKYGSDGVMDYEGFEHLLDNLGLGGGIFANPHELEKHRINGTFSQIHDASHKHKRHATTTNAKSKLKHCLSPHDILEVYGFENQFRTIINQNTFMSLCPALVYQLEERLCMKAAPQKEIGDVHLSWIYAGLCILLISATGLLGVALMPLIHSRIFDKLLHFMVALAIGTLCGDALLHLLPHALELHHHDKDSAANQLFKCSVTLLAVLVFFSIETVMTMIVGGSGSHRGHSHRRRDDAETNAMFPAGETRKRETAIAPVSVMVILGDALHNITDGLAIGAAFSSDPVTGFATAIAIFCHELPHELGDFAVLLRNGMSLRRAICCNVLSSVLSFAGTAAGLWLGDLHSSSSQWIYAATAGTFLYIALVDLIPELGRKGNVGVVEFSLSVLGILLGFAIMLSIALYEDSLVVLLE